MRWELVSSDARQEVYHLFKNDKKLLTLVIDPFSNTARVECANEKRVFQLRKEGFLRNKTVIRNEYGIKIGELGQENKQNFIDVNNERFNYSIDEGPSAKLVLYKEAKDQPFVTCRINSKEARPDDPFGRGNSVINFKKDKSLGSASHPGLLMALCWYMFLPVAKESAAAVV